MGLPTFIVAVLALFPPHSRKSHNDPEKGAGEVAEDIGEAVAEDVSSDESGDEGEGGTSAWRDRIFRSRSGSTATNSRRRSTSVPFKVTFSWTNTMDTTLSAPSIFVKAKEFIFPSEDSAALDRFVPHYRWTPIISGTVIPFSILLEIPGLTERWYIRTDGYETVETKPNPPLLDFAMAVSIACALIANICLLLRFLEKRVRTMTLLTIAFLTVHGEALVLLKFRTRFSLDRGRYHQYYHRHHFRCGASL